MIMPKASFTGYHGIYSRILDKSKNINSPEKDNTMTSIQSRFYMADKKYFPLMNGESRSAVTREMQWRDWEEGPLKEENDFEIRDKVKDKFQPYNFSFRADPAKGDMIYITMTFFNHSTIYKGEKSQ